MNTPLYYDKRVVTEIRLDKQIATASLFWITLCSFVLEVAENPMRIFWHLGF